MGRPKVEGVGVKQLGDILVQDGLVTEDQLFTAFREHKEQGKALGRVLVDQGVLTESQLVAALAQQIQRIQPTKLYVTLFLTLNKKAQSSSRLPVTVTKVLVTIMTVMRNRATRLLTTLMSSCRLQPLMHKTVSELSLTGVETQLISVLLA